MDKKEIIVLWSGGIDSTALVGKLLLAGWTITLTVINIYRFRSPVFAQRERVARLKLLQEFQKIPERPGIGSVGIQEIDGSFLWNYSPDGREIPYRNKRMLDFLIARILQRWGVYCVGMGEYIGADSWVVRDHVGAADCDARSLAAYLYNEYGLNYQLITLADFGQSRYKHHRLEMGIDTLGLDIMTQTTNCLMNTEQHCGKCYKCLERRAAFELLGHSDRTEYSVDPTKQDKYPLYLEQMKGIDVTTSISEFD